MKPTYVKAARRMLMKLAPGVNVTNILGAAFMPIYLRQKSTNLKCKYNTYSCKTFVWKAARKMLVKLTPGGGAFCDLDSEHILSLTWAQNMNFPFCIKWNFAFKILLQKNVLWRRVTRCLRLEISYHSQDISCEFRL